MMTHEKYIQTIADLAIAGLPAPERKVFKGFKLAYGAGAPGLRGVTYFDRWGNVDSKAPFVEVCAFGQESAVQLAGTTIHELGHVLAGFSAGHSKAWKDACEKLGLRKIKAAGTTYHLANFAPELRHAIASLPKPDDGAPVRALYNGLQIKPKPCTAGVGTRGGTSRGAGSGSRLRLFVCDCEPPVKVRAGRDELDVTCNCCSGLFHRA